MLVSSSEFEKWGNERGKGLGKCLRVSAGRVFLEGSRTRAIDRIEGMTRNCECVFQECLCEQKTKLKSLGKNLIAIAKVDYEK